MKNINKTLIFYDQLALCFSFLVSFYLSGLRAGVNPEKGFRIEVIHIVVFLFFMMAWNVIAKITLLYSVKSDMKMSTQIVLLGKNGLYLTVVSTMFLFLIKQDYFSRFFNFFFIFVFFGFLVSGRAFYRLLLRKLYQQERFKRRIVIIGIDKISEKFLKSLNTDYYKKHEILGIIDNNKPSGLSEKYLGPIGSLKQILEDQEVEDVIISYKNLYTDELEKILNICDEFPVRIKIISHHADFMPLEFQLSYFENLYPDLLKSDPLNEIYSRMFKRVIDIVGSFIFLLLVFPWMFPLIALMIKLSSKGPVFFIQKRWGRKNKEIKVFKFRTMKISQDNEEFRQAQKNDPRMTWLGRFLRRTSLDELPQFFNVLLGDMSIVGPRPHPIPLNLEAKGKIKNYLKRHLIKPGITGLAQIKGYRGETNDPKLMKMRIKYDLVYIRNWSVWLDFQIIIQTVWKMVTGDPNAY